MNVVWVIISLTAFGVGLLAGRNLLAKDEEDVYWLNLPDEFLTTEQLGIKNKDKYDRIAEIKIELRELDETLTISKYDLKKSNQYSQRETNIKREIAILVASIDKLKAELKDLDGSIQL